MTEISLLNGEPENDFDEEFVNSSYGTFGNFQLVGHGARTNEKCGTFSSYYGCVRTDLHLFVEGCKNKGYVQVVHHSCHKPSCPVCYKSWAVREGRALEGRLAEASKRFGLVEHIVASIPLSSYGLSFEDMRAKTVEALAVRGVVGGVLIFHGFRYDKVRRASAKWYWSPHFHVLGFVKGGYKCRSCVKQFCSSCHGFEGHTRRCFEKDGYIVKVLGERKDVFRTGYYQLNHSTIRTNVKRPHASTWFGVCSYRKLKVKVEKRKALCPICQNELVKLRYFGDKVWVTDRDAVGFEREFTDGVTDDAGRMVWVEDLKYSG